MLDLMKSIVLREKQDSEVSQSRATVIEWIEQNNCIRREERKHYLKLLTYIDNTLL